MPGEFLLQFLRLTGKGRLKNDLSSDNLSGRCHRAGTRQATLEVIGSKQSYDWNGASWTMTMMMMMMQKILTTEEKQVYLNKAHAVSV